MEGNTLKDSGQRCHPEGADVAAGMLLWTSFEPDWYIRWMDCGSGWDELA